MPKFNNGFPGILRKRKILMVHCNCREITSGAIRKEVLDLIGLRLDDMKYLIEKNLDVIAVEAMKGRC